MNDFTQYAKGLLLKAEKLREIVEEVDMSLRQKVTLWEIIGYIEAVETIVKKGEVDDE